MISSFKAKGHYSIFFNNNFALSRKVTYVYFKLFLSINRNTYPSSTQLENASIRLSLFWMKNSRFFNTRLVSRTNGTYCYWKQSTRFENLYNGLVNFVSKKKKKKCTKKMQAEIFVWEWYQIDTIQTVHIGCTIRGSTSRRRHTRGTRPLEARVLFIGMNFLSGFIICGCHGFLPFVTFWMAGTQTTYKKENWKIDNARLFGCDSKALVKSSVNATLLTTIKNCTITYIVNYVLFDYGTELFVPDISVVRTSKKKTKKQKSLIVIYMTYITTSGQNSRINWVVLNGNFRLFFLFRLDDIFKCTYISTCIYVYVPVKI